MADDIEIQIFKPGTHVSTAGDEITFSADDVRRMATAYDPATHEAPVCVGHPKLDAPAYGWVSSLRVGDDGALFARLSQVDPAFAGLVKDGRYKKVSAAFFARPSNDEPWRLRHVGFLGAAAPAVQGLRPATFAAGETVEFAGGAGETPAPTPDFAAPPPPPKLETPPMPTPPVAPDAAREAELAKREAEIARREGALRDAEFASAIDALIADGRVHPSEKDALVAFASRLDGGAVSFAAPDGAARSTTLPAEFAAILSARPRVVEPGVVAPPGPVDPAPTFAAAPGYAVDPDRAALHAKALAHQAAHPGVSYADALRAIGA